MQRNVEQKRKEEGEDGEDGDDEDDEREEPKLETKWAMKKKTQQKIANVVKKKRAPHGHSVILTQPLLMISVSSWGSRSPKKKKKKKTKSVKAWPLVTGANFANE